MATGYTRTDTANNIATGNTINASDFDNEFDAIQSAMDVSTGHNHDGTVGGGAPIAALGPAQDVVITVSAMRPKTDNTVDLGTSSLEFKDLYIDGTANIDTLQVDESATITANLTVSGNATISTNLTVNGNTVIGNATTDTINVIADFISDLVPDADNTYDLGLSTNEWRNLWVDGTANIDTLQVDESATITADLTVNGNTTLGNAAGDTVTVTARVASNLVPSTDDTYDLGTSGNEWKDLYIDGTARVDTLQVDESATITADLTVNGNTTLGNATGDTVTFTARAASNFLPSVDGTYDLGSSANEWQDLYIDGVARIDSLIADTVDINAGTAILSSAKVITANGGNVTVQRDDTSITSGETLGVLDFQAPNVSGGGNAILVTAAVKAVADTTFDATNNKTSLIFQTANAGAVVTRVEVTGDGHVLPGTDDTYDLGASGTQWRNLWIDGTANIDDLVADTADINGGTIDGTTIGATTAAAGTFTSVTAPSVTITGGTINGTTIGATTAAAGTFTNITATGGSITGITDLAVADGGTGVSTLTGYVKGNGTSAFTGSASIPNTDITGLGTMSTQAASAVAITGGSINGTTIGATTASTVAGTTGTFSGAVTASSLTTTAADSTTTTVMLQGFRAGSGVQTGGAARIRVVGDAAGNATQMIFDTNSTAAVRIDGSGNFLASGITDTNPVANNVAGINLSATGTLHANVDATFHRIGRRQDGVVMSFYSAGTSQGSIQIASGVVSLNPFLGSHWAALSDWSRPDIKMGTIMETINELVEWKYVVVDVLGEQKKIAYNGTSAVGDTVSVEFEGQTYEGTLEKEINPLLNKHVKVKVSDTPESKAVFGVFLYWNTDVELDGGVWNDMSVAAVGNFVVRMAAGQTPEIGDLVVSDGTGCGVVQADDSIRTKTVAKVTSTIPQIVYEDGSFLVTCVLYCG